MMLGHQPRRIEMADEWKRLCNRLRRHLARGGKTLVITRTKPPQGMILVSNSRRNRREQSYLPSPSGWQPRDLLEGPGGANKVWTAIGTVPSMSSSIRPGMT
jgi:hypothetical protein